MKTLLIKADGTQGECERIDPKTGDYVLDLQGLYVGDSALAQMVYLALRTELGSAAVTTLGIEPPGPVVRDDFRARRRLAVEAALRRLTASGALTIVDVLVRRVSPTAMQTEVQWRPTGGALTSTFV